MCNVECEGKVSAYACKNRPSLRDAGGCVCVMKLCDEVARDSAAAGFPLQDEDLDI